MSNKNLSSKPSNYNSKLLEIIEEKIPHKHKQLELLMNNVSLSKEAAYRRLRGDVPFSFSEAALRFEELELPLDLAAKEAVNKKHLTFQLQTLPYSSITDELSIYYEQAYTEEYEYMLRDLSSHPSSSISIVINTIPQVILYPYEHLSKVKTLSWKYQMQSTPIPQKLSSINIDKNIQRKQEYITQNREAYSENTFILSRYIFSAFIQLIQYYHTLKIINDSEILIIKDELMELIADLEQLTKTDTLPNGNKVWIYLSNIDSESNYTYIKADDYQRASINIYHLNYMTTSDPYICEIHQKWIKSIKKYSTLISASGNIERKLFFEKQRELVRTF